MLHAVRSGSGETDFLIIPGNLGQGKKSVSVCVCLEET